MAKFAPGFIAKAEMENVPLIGRVAKQIDCLFVKREDSSNRNEIVSFDVYLNSCNKLKKDNHSL